MLKFQIDSMTKCYKLVSETDNFFSYAISLFFITIFITLLDAIGILILVPIFETIFNLKLLNDSLSVFVKLDLFNFESWNYTSKTILVAFLIALLVLIKFLISIANNTINLKLLNAICQHLTSKSFDKLLKTSITFIESKKKGELRNHCQTMPAQIADMACNYIKLFSTLFIIVIYLIFLFTLSFYLTLLIGLLSIVFSLSINSLAKKQTKIGEKLNSQNALFNQTTIDIILSRRIIYLFDLKSIFDNKLIYELKDRLITSFRLGLINSLSQPIMNLFGGLIIFISLIFFSINYDNLEWLTTFTLFCIILFRMLVPVTNFNTSRIKIASVSSILHLYLNFMKIMKDNELKFGTIKLKEFNKKITFRNVGFNYGKETILRNINLSIKKGDRVAIVGASGAGKSTLIDLILGVNKPTEGEITVDNIKLNNLDIKSWHDQISYAPQNKNYIFYDNIKNNISLYKKFHKDKMKLILNHVGLATLKVKAKNLGDNGSKLSGGQKQRIAIARSLMRESKIFIFDEATSQIDRYLELKIYNLKNIIKNFTSITIAHSIYTIQNSTIIFVLRNGRIIAKGSHSNLKKNCSYYSDLIKKQIIN